MKKLPIGIQTFREIREENHCYVDKTPHILDLIRSGKYYFLSRPRRFGKSLLVDTMRELFLANEALFKGLSIHPRWDWTTVYPVILIPFGRGIVENRRELDQKIRIFLDEIADHYQMPLRYDSSADRFHELIKGLCDKWNQRVVILVDEYDKPILDNISRPDPARNIRDGLRSFYSVIKDADPYVKFAFITGVSKFSKVSLFSGLNNLEDITLSPSAATLCGYTREELHTVFADHLSGVDPEELAAWYNGYNFLGEPLYNPFDVLLYLKKRKFEHFWFETATPTFLVQLLESRPFPIPRLEGLKASAALLSDFDVDRIHLEALLFQTGYLTIRSTKQIGSMTQYELDYPNRAVKSGLTDFLLDYLVADPPSK